MTEPLTYSFQPPETIQALQLEGTTWEQEAVAAWMEGVKKPGVVIQYVDWMQRIFVTQASGALDVELSNWVYLDENGDFAKMAAPTFAMLFKVAAV
jgi:hypothetical protein